MRKSLNRYRLLYLISAMLLFVAIQSTQAQEFRGTITGSVQDQSGAIVPGATVTIKNNETNVSNITTTNSDGAYTFLLLLPGKYSISATNEGFKTSSVNDIELRVGDLLTIDVKLAVGLTTEVNIIADAELVERGSVSTGTVVTQRQIEELPLSEGAAYSLATQAPGVTYTGNPQFTGPTANGNLAAIRSNGANGNQINLDGSPNLGFDGSVAFTPPADALSQFKIQTNAFDAQNGYTAGSTVNAAVKSGTNKLHGSAFYFNRPGKLTANNFFNNKLGEPRPPRAYYRYGGQVNGPIVKDRTFFMFSYEKQRDERAEPETFTVPTLKMRTGDFSELLSLTTPVLIYDPATAVLRNTTCTAGSSGTTVCRTPFAGNIIPTARLNPASVAFLNLFPKPNQAGIVDNYFSNQTLNRPYYSYLTRIDHNFDDNSRVFGKYYYSKSQEDRYNWLDTPDSFTQGYEYRTNNGGNVDFTSALTPTLILDIRSSLTSFAQLREPTAPLSAAQLGFTAIAGLTTSNEAPRFDFTNYDTLGAERSDFNQGLNRKFTLFSLQPTFTQIKGEHTIKYGLDYRNLNEKRTTNGYNAGRFTFDGVYTSQASNTSSTIRNQTGPEIAAFLLGIPSAGSNSFIEQAAKYDVNVQYYGLFIHDDWRVTPRLSLNLGLRYEVETGVHEKHGRMVAGFDTTGVNPLASAVLANYNSSVPTSVPIEAFQNLKGGLYFAGSSGDPSQSIDWDNFQPRIGLSYSIGDKTVVRGGFGVFATPFQVVPIDQSGYRALTTFSPTTNNGLTITSTLNNPFPNGLNPALGSLPGMLTFLGTSIGTLNATGPTATTIYQNERKNGRYSRFIGSIQHELPWEIGVEGTFIYSKGADLPVLRQLNYIPTQYLNNFAGSTDAAAINTAVTNTNTFLNATVANPFRGLVPTNSTLNAATIQRRFLLTAFPQFQDLVMTEYNGSSTYTSAQFQLSKRMSQGISLNASYTWSRDKEKIRRLNPQDTELNESLSVNDRPHRFTFSSVWELPFGKERTYFSNWNSVAEAVLGGWQLNSVYEWQSGEPLVLQNAVYTGDITQLQNLLGQRDSSGVRYGVAGGSPAFNTAGFINLANNYTVSSQNSLRVLPYTMDNFRNQAFQKLDLGLTKNFRIREGMKLQVRVEAINAFNWVYLGSGLQLSVTNAAFGYVGGQRNLPRDIQIGGRFTF